MSTFSRRKNRLNNINNLKQNYSIFKDTVIYNFTKLKINITNDEKDASGKLIDKRKLEADDVKFKYETNAEWKKAGLSDPYED